MNRCMIPPSTLYVWTGKKLTLTYTSSKPAISQRKKKRCKSLQVLSIHKTMP